MVLNLEALAGRRTLVTCHRRCIARRDASRCQFSLQEWMAVQVPMINKPMRHSLLLGRQRDALVSAEPTFSACIGSVSHAATFRIIVPSRYRKRKLKYTMRETTWQLKTGRYHRGLNVRLRKPRFHLAALVKVRRKTREIQAQGSKRRQM
jgi:hypothetical protein